MIPNTQTFLWIPALACGLVAGLVSRASAQSRVTYQEQVLPLVETKMGAKVDSVGLRRIELGMPGVKQRAHTLIELADSLVFYARHGAPTIVDDKARALLTAEARSLLGKLSGALDAQAADWGEKQVEDAIRRFAEAQGVKLGQVAQPLRVALTGSTASPGIFEVLAVLGASETKTRLQAAAG